MIEYLTPAVIANPPDADIQLTHEQLWQALVWKAKYAQLFVAPIKECRVLETYEDGFLREALIENKDGSTEAIQERIFLDPMRTVTFLRLNGGAYGQIVNSIESEAGELVMRFGFTFALQGAAHGGPEEAAYEEEFAAGYVVAVESTLEATREFVRTGVDPTLELQPARAAS